jgi:hypothetical protein
MFESRIVLMVIFAAIISAMTAFLKFETKAKTVRGALRMFGIMVAGGILLSWLMAWI